MTVSPSTPASTIAAIAILVAFCVFPIVIYLRIILNFITDRKLQAELSGKSVGSLKLTKPSRVSPPRKILLSFEDVRYTVKRTGKEILKGVSGYFLPYTLTAILGTSGCGKTSLLTVLADQSDTTAETAGRIYMNGTLRDDRFRRSCAYVMQSDNLLECLTVREFLWFTAELRLGAFSNEEKMDVVRTVITDLDLGAAADRRISVLSGGQKRRVTVATELVALPSLIFLDEPTTGLDASASLKLVKVLRKLAESGRTVVCTIHQPRVDAFQLFHMVYLMNAGNLLYFGPLTKIIPYFSHLGKMHIGMGYSHSSMHESVRNLVVQEEEDVEEVVNPADFVLDFTKGSAEEVSMYCEAFSKSEIFVKMQDTLKLIHSGTLEPGTNFAFIKDDQEWFPEMHSMPPAGNVSHFSSGETRPNNQSNDNADFANQCGNCHRCSCEPNDDLCRKCCPSRYATITKYASTNIKQTFTLVRRALLSSTRNTSYLMSWVLGIVMMLFMGMLYCYVDPPKIDSVTFHNITENLEQWGACTQNLTDLAIILQTNVSQVNQTLWNCGEDVNKAAQLDLARTSLLYQLLASMFFSEMPLVASIHADRNLYIREHASRSYSSLSWSLSWICRIAFTGIVKGLVFPPFVYFSAHLALSGEAYVLFSIFMGTMSVMGASVALLVSVAFYSFETASVAFVVVNIFAQNLCGYFIGVDAIPWWFRWIYYINFFHYTFEGIVLSQSLTADDLNRAISLGRLASYEYVQLVAWWWAFIAVMFCVVVQMIAFAIVQVSGNPYICVRGLTKKHDDKLDFAPVQMNGGFALTVFKQNDVTTSTTGQDFKESPTHS